MEQHRVQQHQRGNLAHGGGLLHLIGVYRAGINPQWLGESGVGHLQGEQGLRQRVDALLELFHGAAHFVFRRHRLISLLQGGGESVQVPRAPVGSVH